MCSIGEQGKMFIFLCEKGDEKAPVGVYSAFPVTRTRTSSGICGGASRLWRRLVLTISHCTTDSYPPASLYVASSLPEHRFSINDIPAVCQGGHNKVSDIGPLESFSVVTSVQVVTIPSLAHHHRDSQLLSFPSLPGPLTPIDRNFG